MAASSNQLRVNGCFNLISLLILSFCSIRYLSPQDVGQFQCAWEFPFHVRVEGTLMNGQDEPAHRKPVLFRQRLTSNFSPISRWRIPNCLLSQRGRITLQKSNITCKAPLLKTSKSQWARSLIQGGLLLLQVDQTAEIKKELHTENWPCYPSLWCGYMKHTASQTKLVEYSYIRSSINNAQ